MFSLGRRIEVEVEIKVKVKGDTEIEVLAERDRCPGL